MTGAKANYAYPNARLILRADAPLDEWLAARTEGIGGSDVSALFGPPINVYADSYTVWLDKRGYSRPKTQTDAMRWGKLHEPAMRKAFTEDTGLKVRSAGLLRSKSHPFMQVTLDGLVEDGGIFESKTLMHYTQDQWEDGQVSDHAELQVQHGMAVTGRSHAWVVGLINGRDFRIRRVERDDVIIGEIIKVEERFWTENVLTDEAPAMTYVSLDAVKDQYQVGDGSVGEVLGEEAARLRHLWDKLSLTKKVITNVKQREELLQAQIRAIIGSNNQVMVDNEPMLTLVNNGTFSKTKFIEENPDRVDEFTADKKVFDHKLLEAADPELYTKYRARVLRAAPKKKAGKK